MKILDARLTADGTLELVVSYVQKVQTQGTVTIPSRDKLLSHTIDPIAKDKLEKQTDAEYYADAISALPAAFEPAPASSSPHPGLDLARDMIGQEFDFFFREPGRKK